MKLLQITYRSRCTHQRIPIWSLLLTDFSFLDGRNLFSSLQDATYMRHRPEPKAS